MRPIYVAFILIISSKHIEVTLVENSAIKSSGCVIMNGICSWQPLLSSTNILYDPLHNRLNVGDI